MRKILFYIQRVSYSSLANKVAEENPDIQIDLVGPKIENGCKRLKYLGEDVYGYDPLSRMQDLSKNNYDFIFAADIFWQLQKPLHEWKKNLKTPLLCPEYEVGHLEYSKISTKKILRILNIPNPDFEIIEEDIFGRPIAPSQKFLQENQFILKLDKTSVNSGYQTLYANKEDYRMKIYENIDHCSKFFVEKKLQGKEFSAHFICNGNNLMYVGSSRDYKKIYENDQGFNTGSTGCYSSVNFVTDEIEKTVTDYARKILGYLNENGISYNGFMYLGCLISNGTVNVLEINTRVGNPEFSSILETYESKNLLNNLLAAQQGEKFDPIKINKSISAVAVLIFNKNYSALRKNKVNYPKILNDKFKSFSYNHFNTHGNYMSGYINRAESRQKAAQEIFDFLEKFDLEDFTYRKDIGYLE